MNGLNAEQPSAMTVTPLVLGLITVLGLRATVGLVYYLNVDQKLSTMTSVPPRL